MDPSRLHLVVSTSAGAAGLSGDQCREAADAGRTELHRILGSAQFDASDRNRRFLEYVVEETLLGRGDRIKAYSIATIVFGRDDSFDPAVDPVVRMEARRLRRSLERFYLVEGQLGPTRIELPKGGYAPKFQASTELAPASDQMTRFDGPSAGRGRSLLVSSFDEEPGGKGDLACSRKLARRIVVGLSRVPGLTIFMPVPACGSRRDDAERERPPPVDFVLAGSLLAGQDELKVEATLSLAHNGRVVWAETLVGDISAAGEVGARDKIADLIIQNLREHMTPDPQVLGDSQVFGDAVLMCAGNI